MGTFKFVGFVVLFCGLFLCFDQQEEEAILWTPTTQLGWNDFKGRPTNNRAAAITASGISYRFSSLSKGDVVQLDFTVNSYFYPNQSWYRPDLCDSVILGHEQLHFDISELYARKMRKQLNETRFTKNVKAEVRAIYKTITKELNDFQNRYDSETNFSRNREQQLLWNAKINEALGK